MVFLFTLILIAMLVALTIIDARSYRLPDILTLPLIGLGVLQAFVLKLSWVDSLIGAVIGYAAFVVIEIGFKKLRGKDGLGRGDAKLLAAGGAWCGWSGLPLIVLIGSFMALIALLFPSFRRRSESGRIPFGPFLALGIACVWGAIHFAPFTDLLGS
jgi:prepilin signal peptidase PulO-like enzyme (type II secretory pathway)